MGTNTHTPPPPPPALGYRGRETVSENTQKVAFTSHFPIWVEPSPGDFTHFLLRVRQPQWTQAVETGRIRGPGKAQGRTMASGGSDLSTRPPLLSPGSFQRWYVRKYKIFGALVPYLTWGGASLGLFQNLFRGILIEGSKRKRKGQDVKD
ncbi:hypothetical protein QTO34_002751 [Cnephaeus nilssonii]|uniref:Uncharacterized protein n=1 Tax=Cnephaeus nilssonii TaxID=3371016 RepID=A0AA40HSQ6_CNENI|nr:hypothetical protein QTO34_002751 [Eptesicus nilssonii]